MQSIIDYAYNGSIVLTTQSAQCTMQIASYFQLVSIFYKNYLQFSKNQNLQLFIVRVNWEQATEPFCSCVILTFLKPVDLSIQESILDECAIFMIKRIRYDDAIPFLALCRHLDYHKIDASIFAFIDVRFWLEQSFEIVWEMKIRIFFKYYFPLNSFTRDNGLNGM